MKSRQRIAAWCLLICYSLIVSPLPANAVLVNTASVMEKGARGSAEIANTESINPAQPEENTPGGPRNSWRKAAETDEIILYYAVHSDSANHTDNYTNTAAHDNAGNCEIIIEDKRNGHVWSSAADLEKYDEENVNNLIKSRMTALFDFKYTNTSNKKYAIVAIDYTSHKPEVSIEQTGSGINMLYKFIKLGITIPISISIERNILTASISAEKIKEEGEYHLISIDLMPFLGSSNNKEQGYMFYPDGSGALFRFKNEPKKNINRSSFYIYGTDSLDLEEYEDNQRKKTKTAMLPVFGVKKGENAAFIAAITKGEYDAAVIFTPSGFSNIHLNRISTEFTYRRTYSDLRSDPNIPPRIETELLKADREVKYFFLANDDADYSGMANEYRGYLVEKGDLVNKNDSNSRTVPGSSENLVPLSLDLFMGIKEERILFDKFVRATTFKQSKTILEKFYDQGVDNIHVKLTGWSTGGYGAYPVIFPPERRLGGAGDLKELIEYTKEKGYLLYLDTNFTDGTKDGGGFSIRNDTVYSKNGLIVTNRGKDHFLLNPVIVLDIFSNRFINKAKELGVDGLCFERMGNQLFRDYNKKYPVTREKTAEYWQRMLETTRNILGNSSTAGGNAYTLKHINRLFDIPVEDSGNIITNETIPFYQMVIHGYIPYSSTPGNLFYDYKKQKLKWVEYGCIPYFKLTYNKSDVLKYTDYNTLFSSYYKDWIDIAVETYKEFNERLGSILAQVMIRHEQPQENIYKITYADGTRIYINYNEANVLIDSYEIKAEDYVVVDREGNVR